MSKSAKSVSPKHSAINSPTSAERKPTQSIIKDIQRQTRRQYTAEEKIRIVIEGLQGEQSVTEICRREGLNTNIYYYNRQRYHESMANVTPTDMYWGRYEQILAERQKIKQLTMAQRRKNYIYQKLQSPSSHLYLSTFN